MTHSTGIKVITFANPIGILFTHYNEIGGTKCPSDKDEQQELYFGTANGQKPTGDPAKVVFVVADSFREEMKSRRDIQHSLLSQQWALHSWRQLRDPRNHQETRDDIGAQ